MVRVPFYGTGGSVARNAFLLDAPFIHFALPIVEALYALEHVLRVTDGDDLILSHLYWDAVEAPVASIIGAGLHTDVHSRITSAEQALVTIITPLTKSTDRGPLVDRNTFTILRITPLTIRTLDALTVRDALTRFWRASIASLALNEDHTGRDIPPMRVAPLVFGTAHIITEVAALTGLEVAFTPRAAFGGTGANDTSVALAPPLIHFASRIAYLFDGLHGAIRRIELKNLPEIALPVSAKFIRAEFTTDLPTTLKAESGCRALAIGIHTDCVQAGWWVLHPDDLFCSVITTRRISLQAW